MTYQIETRRDGIWTTEGLGDSDANIFETAEEAGAILDLMVDQIPDWADHEYRIVEAAK